MPHYLIFPSTDSGRGWVLAEVIDESWAETVGQTVGALHVSREEALADPDLRMSLFAWEAGDDSDFEHFDAQETAEREA